jgi:hypothetical protein
MLLSRKGCPEIGRDGATSRISAILGLNERMGSVA